MVKTLKQEHMLYIIKVICCIIYFISKYIMFSKYDIFYKSSLIIICFYISLALLTTVLISCLIYKKKNKIQHNNIKRKSCLVYGYFNNNLGDDLFFKILFNRYKNVDFYIFPPSVLLDKYKKIFEDCNNVIYYDNDKKYIRIKNEVNDDNADINVFPIMCERAKKVDYFIMIGGSMFIQNTNWKKEDRFILKNIINDKPSFIVGCNFDSNDKEYCDYYKNWFKKFDDVCFRDEKSYKKFDMLSNIRCADDIVLLIKKKIRISLYNKTVGISVIDPLITQKLYKKFEEYYNFLVTTIDYYLDKEFKIKLFCFCKNEGDLRAIEYIYSKINNKNINNIEIVEYSTDIDDFLKKWKSCYYIIGTRFHANILALVYEQKFIPIIYSNKTYNYLKKIDDKFEIYEIDELNKIKKEKLKYKRIRKKYDSKKQFLIIDQFLKERR